MNVNKIGIINNAPAPAPTQTQTPAPSGAVNFRGEKEHSYENPISRHTERNLAILSSTGVAAVLGAIVYGLTTSFGFQNKRIAPVAGAATAAAALALTLPANLYHTKVNAFVKQKEMDVFSRDRSLKTELTEEVDKEVQDEKVTLDKKLDDNLKLQMANRSTAVGIANITPAQAPAQG